MTAINEIDYERLADLSEKHNVPFHTLCLRAEKGQSLINLVQEDPDEWVTYQQAARVLNVTYMTISGAFTKGSDELDYYGIEWKSRSLSKPKGKRGCGVIFKREDLETIRNIRSACSLQLMAALRVFQAMKQKRI